jgi:thioesterase domain-containing protein/acyl carrier protein
VLFSKAVQWLVERDYDLLLECGPRATSCTLVRQHFPPDRSCAAIPSLTDTHENHAEWAALLFALGSLWQSGVSIDWEAFYAYEERRRIPLPTYPFERQRYWVEPAASTAEVSARAQMSAGLLNAEHVDAAPLLALGGSVMAAASAALFERASVEPPAISVASHDAHQMEPDETRSSRLAARLVEILVPVSGRDPSQISTSATLMEQGFDSLSLTQVAFAIRKEFGVRVSFSQLMKDFPSIEMLAAHLDAALAPDVFAAIPAAVQNVKPSSEVADASSVDSRLKFIEAVVAEQSRKIDRLINLLDKQGDCGYLANPRESPNLLTRSAPNDGGGARPESDFLTVPATAPQRAIFASSRLSDNLSASYNESMTLRLTGTISVPKLTCSIERLVQRHDALRASFDESGAFMRIRPVPKIEIPVTDLSTVSSPVAREESLRQLLQRETAKPFPLPGGPLFRSQIVLLGSDSAALVITGHHIICDGWSLDVLIHDLCAIYSEEISGQPAQLKPVVSYADYDQSVAQRERSEEYREARDYWHQKFAAGFDALILPTDHARPVRREFAARRLDRGVPAPVVQSLRALAAEQGCGFFSVILTALSVLLARISRQRRFVLALPTADQPVMGQPDLVGHCVSLLPFAVSLAEGESVKALLARVQNDLAAAQDHSAYTLISLLEELRPVATVCGASPTAVGLTNVRKFQPQELPQAGFSADYEANPMSFLSFEWYLNVVEVGNTLELNCHYDTGLFERNTVQAWLEAFDGILRDIVADPSREAAKLAGLNGEGKSSAPEVLYALAGKKGAGEVLPLRTLTWTHGNGAPRNETEKALAKIWQEVLGVENLGIHDDFFELGGQSLLAVAIQTKVERAFGKRLPLASLIQASTIEQFADLVGGEKVMPAWSSLVPLRATGSKPPLFLMHSHGGNVLEYHPLASHLGKDQPVYALQARGLDGGTSEEPRIEAMASSYIKDIKTVQPHGPYYLGGYCFGGALALEAARQLSAQNESVGLLILINAPTPAHWGRQMEMPFPRRLFYRLAYRLALERSNLSGKPFRKVLAQLIARGRRFKDIYQARAEMLLESLLRPWHGPSFAHSVTYDLERLAKAHDLAGAAYVPKPYSGKVIHLVAKCQPFALRGDPMQGWAGLFRGGCRVKEIPSFREQMLAEPNVEILASAIASELRACDGRAKDHEGSPETGVRTAA